MVSGTNWREEINREFYFLYAHGYALTRIAVQKNEAEAIFTGHNRAVAIRWDDTDHLYVQIYRTEYRWNLLQQGVSGINLFEFARKSPPGLEISVEAGKVDHRKILHQNATFMQERLGAVLDGSRWP
jgi:hypothetical protein